jgi:hypothetical protein
MTQTERNEKLSEVRGRLCRKESLKCKDCGRKVRGPFHEEGEHHNGGVKKKS